MAEDQVFEFKGNALMYFRVRVRSASLSVSTLRSKGGEAVKTWDVDFARVDDVRLTERRGTRTSNSALYLKPRGGDLVMFGWQKSLLGAPASDALTYYTAASATLRALAEHKPELKATIGPNGTSSLVGAALGSVVFVVIAYLLIGEFNTTFALVGAAIVTAYAFSAARSGAFQKSRQTSLVQAADELAAKNPQKK